MWPKASYHNCNGRMILRVLLWLPQTGYPESPQKGDPIQGDVLQTSYKQYFLHAGTKKDKGQWLTHGGRVLNAVGYSKKPLNRP